MASIGSVQRLGYGELFRIFFKAGLAFGGGLGILAALEDEFVGKRGLITREDFLAVYGLGRVVPSGTMTALAVAYGYQFGGLPGTVVALAAMALPAFILTVALTIAYGFLRGDQVLGWLDVSVLPAAVGFIMAAAVKLGRPILRPAPDLALAAAAFVGVFWLDANPALLLVLGGLAGIVLFRRREGPGDDAA
jgi:chromate transporter